MSNPTPLRPAPSRDVEATPATSSGARPPAYPVPRLYAILLEMLWKAFDAVVLFRMGTIYMHRFEDFSYTSHGEYNDELDREITAWRTVQQEEWTRLSNTLALLGTMNAAIIKVAPDTGTNGVSVSLWLGAAGLSLCGVFMVQYFSIRAFPMANRQLRDLVFASPHRKRQYVSRKVLAIAISGPPLMTLWASTLFVVGIIIYIWETKFYRTRYRVFALVPVLGGALIAIISLILGEIIGTMMYFERSREGIRRWCNHTVGVPTPPTPPSVWQKLKLWREHRARRDRGLSAHDLVTNATGQRDAGVEVPPAELPAPQQTQPSQSNQV